MAWRAVVLDTNVIISAIVYGGMPAKILQAIVAGKFKGVISDFIIGEVIEVLGRTKIGFSRSKSEAIRQKIRDTFKIVQTNTALHVLRDEPDNRVLETAIAGRCKFIVTGDKELLELEGL